MYFLFYCTALIEYIIKYKLKEYVDKMCKMCLVQ